MLAIVCLLALAAEVFSFKFPTVPKTTHTLQSPGTSLRMTKNTIPGLGGRVVVSGIGYLDEDEFMLNLLNEQVYFHSLPNYSTSSHRYNFLPLDYMGFYSARHRGFLCR